MGRASKWLRNLFGGRKADPHPHPPQKKWRFSSKARRHTREEQLQQQEQVRAAITIQSHFRAYLSKRALRALKALVKLQALVRGHILRKQMASVMRQMEALVRAQARAQARRVLNSEAHNLSHFNHAGLRTSQKMEQMIKAHSMKHGQPRMPKRSASKSSGNIVVDAEQSHSRWVDRGSSEGSWEQGYYNFTPIIPTDDGKQEKILEVDTWRPKQRATPQRRHIFHSSDLSDQYCQSFSMSLDSTAHQTALSGEVQSFGPLKHNIDENSFYTPDSSPRIYSSGSSRQGAFTSNKTEGFKSGVSGYADHPNYMSCTESSKAKVRSFSAPKQRLHNESVYTYAEKRSHINKASLLHSNFTSKAYPGSGRQGRLGLSVGAGGSVSSYSGPWHRY